MQPELSKAIEILERTPEVISSLLGGLSEGWIHTNEGKESWSPFDVVGHLIEGELTDWMTRTKIILSQRESPIFDPFDRFVQIENNKGKSFESLLDKFSELRKLNIQVLKKLDLTKEQLNWKGIHPEFGKVTLYQLLSTWVAHDLTHIAQISRVMAKHYQFKVGPWKQYLPILKS